MIQLPEDRRPPLTPELALRVAVVGSLALAMFAIIFFRLWFLQVLSGDQYLKAATFNRVRDIAIAAPRGEILDRNGQILVSSTKALAVQISPPDLPASPAAQRSLFRRLAKLLGVSTKRVNCKVVTVKLETVKGVLHSRLITSHLHLAKIPCDIQQQLSLLPYDNVTIKSDVPKDVQYYLAERQDQFPGVTVAEVYLPGYPMGTLAAQLLGTVGPINSTEVKQRAYRFVSHNAIIGQSGLEAYYDNFLRGTDGSDRVQVDAFNQPTGELSVNPPIPGHNLALSLDANLQRAGAQALATSIASNPGATGGAFVAMNPQNGEVYAMGSSPTFDPTVFTKPLSYAEYGSLTNQASGDPLLNRATQSAGPTGSTFKPITATAALSSGLWSIDGIFDDTGQFCVGTGGAQQCRHNAGNAVDGSLDLVNALRVSSDDFFYNLGAVTNPADPATHPSGGPLDTWAYKFGIGRLTGIDLPGEVQGTLPTPAWRTGRNRLEAECDNATGPFRYTNGHSTGPRKLKGWYRSPKHSPGGCGIADGTNRPWSIGDNESLAVGQGDVQVTPLQLAVAYAALANGGTIVRPHLGLDVQNADGTVLQNISPPSARHININSLYLETIRQGLRDAASQPGGTSYDVMGNFPEQVYGKTGTAQYSNQTDYSWYACFVPASATTKPIVVVVHVERGGFGDVAAAPVARQILSQWFFGKPGAYKSGTSATL
jgi:penicillin-binding protein 2